MFFLLFSLTFRSRSDFSQRQQVEIVAFGDSVFGEVRNETAVPAQVGALIGKTVYNAALGGTCASRQDVDRRLDRAKDSLSLVGLAVAMGAEDFGVQQSARLRESNMEYFPEVIDGLEGIDFNKVQIILIQHGINDYHAGTLIDNPENPYDVYTFLGAIRRAVAAFRDKNPQVRIVLVTPAYTWYTATGLTCEETDQGGGVLEDYVNAEIRLGEELGIEVVDLYHDCLPHENWWDWETYTRDGLHPNEAGRKLLSQKIAEALK
jgi:lysophospholipase L1-like esterase